jgi:hypothetical protein
MLNSIKGKYLEHRWEITLLLIISSCYAIGLEILRIVLSGHRNYFYFIWNLFLAWIPYLLGMYLPVSFHVVRSRFILVFFTGDMVFVLAQFALHPYRPASPERETKYSAVVRSGAGPFHLPGQD